jgi:hypothetical protein
MILLLLLLLWLVCCWHCSSCCPIYIHSNSTIPLLLQGVRLCCICCIYWSIAHKVFSYHVKAAAACCQPCSTTSAAAAAAVVAIKLHHSYAMITTSCYKQHRTAGWPWKLLQLPRRQPCLRQQPAFVFVQFTIRTSLLLLLLLDIRHLLIVCFPACTAAAAAAATANPQLAQFPSSPSVQLPIHCQGYAMLSSCCQLHYTLAF